MEISCRKCGNKNQNELALHHIIPKHMGGTDKDGRRYLCDANKGNDCHRKFHKELNTEFKEKIREFTLKWLNEK